MSFSDDLDELAEPFTERAGIMEFCAGIERQQSEKQATDDSEPHRHECEVRTVAAWGDDDERTGDERRRDFLERVSKHRGNEAAQRLRRDIWDNMRGKNGKA